MPRSKRGSVFNDGEVEPKGRRRINLTTGAFVRKVEVGGKRGDWHGRRNSELIAAAQGAPEVVMKMWSGGKTFQSVEKCLSYVSRSARLPLTTEDGDKVKGPEALRALLLEWRDGGSPIPDQSALNEYQVFVFCAPQTVPPEIVVAAAREVTLKTFDGFQHISVLHCKETDPSDRASVHPHVHLVVKTRSFKGDRLNLGARRAMHLRELYAQALRDRGISVAATRVFDRFSARELTSLPADSDAIDPDHTFEQMAAFKTYSALWESLQKGDSSERLAASLVAAYIRKGTGIEIDKGVRKADSERVR